MDQMSLVYYLFLQDRTEEALARFHAIPPKRASDPDSIRLLLVLRRLL